MAEVEIINNWLDQKIVHKTHFWKEVGVSPQFWGMVTRGERKPPPKTIAKIFATMSKYGYKR